MITVRIKQVPEKTPNADGDWIEVGISNYRWKNRPEETYSWLSRTFCGHGHQAVQYEIVKKETT